MDAGKLRHRLTIQHIQGTTLDAAGQPVPNWQPLGKCWASVTPLAGLEQWHGMQVSPEITHGIEIRFRRGLTTAMRFLHRKTRILNIESILNVDERDEKLLIACKEAV